MKEDSLTNFFINKSLFIGLVMFFASFFYFPKSLLIVKNSLVEIKGKVVSVEENDIKIVEDELLNIEKTVRTDLQIKLRNDTKIYSLRDIGHIDNYFIIDKVQTKFLELKNVILWVKKDDLSKVDIEVYSISDKNRKVLFGIENLNSRNRKKFYFLFGIGIAGILNFVLRRFYLK